MTIRDYQADRRKAVEAAMEVFVSQGLPVPDHLYKLIGQSKPRKPKAESLEHKAETSPVERVVPEPPKPADGKLKPSSASS